MVTYLKPEFDSLQSAIDTIRIYEKIVKGE